MVNAVLIPNSVQVLWKTRQQPGRAVWSAAIANEPSTYPAQPTQIVRRAMSCPFHMHRLSQRTNLCLKDQVEPLPRQARAVLAAARAKKGTCLAQPFAQSLRSFAIALTSIAVVTATVAVTSNQKSTRFRGRNRVIPLRWMSTVRRAGAATLASRLSEYPETYTNVTLSAGCTFAPLERNQVFGSLNSI